MAASRSDPQDRMHRAAWRAAWPETQAVFAALTAHGAVARAVGGAVRDTLLGRPVSEIDIAIDVPPQTVLELAAEAGLRAIPTGIDHGTVTLVAGDRNFEVTTLRDDVETYGRRAKVAFTGNWEGDARRRDFTINALYADPDGTLFDPLGGLADIEARKVRFIGEPGERIEEDYLRILRYFRFISELDSPQLDEVDLAACVAKRAGLDQLAPERIQKELLRLLQGAGALRALAAMFDHGLLVLVLAGVAYLPRLERLVAIEAEMERTPDAILRLAALAVAVPEDAQRLADRFRLSNADAGRLAAAAGHRDIDGAMSEKDARERLYVTGPEKWRDHVLMAWAAGGAGPADSGWQALFDLPQRWDAPKFPVSGSDITDLGLAPGPAVGEMLQHLESEWIASGFSATRAELLASARERLTTDKNNLQGSSK